MRRKHITILSSLLLLFYSCEDLGIKTELVSPPVLKSLHKVSVTTAGATFEYEISSDGGAAIIAHGLCWSTFSGPTVGDNKTVEVEYPGVVSRTLPGLSEFTTYYVRAYATNKSGTAYSDEIMFLTPKIFQSMAGVYQFSKVTLASPVSFGGVTLPAGWEVTDELVGVFYSLSPCSDPSALAVNLKTSKQLFFGCTNSSAEVQAGTWDESADLSAMTLMLVIPNPADPANPNLLTLVVENVEAIETTIKGRINNYPLNSYQGNALVPPLILSINVEFGKVP